MRKGKFTDEDSKLILARAYDSPRDHTNKLLLTKSALSDELFFQEFDPGIVTEVFLAVLERYKKYVKEWPSLNLWHASKYNHITHLIAEVFMCGVCVSKKRAADSSPANEAMELFHVYISDEQRTRIMRLLVTMNFHFESSIWSSAYYAMDLREHKDDVVNIICEAVKERRASYSAICHLLRDQYKYKLVDDPSILYVACFLGPLPARLVEKFAADRSSEFREKCREVVLEVEKCASSYIFWTKAVEEKFGCMKGFNGTAIPYYFEGFRFAVHNLVRELRGYIPVDNRIRSSYACSVIKKAAFKYYKEKIWKQENLYEVLWTILAQRVDLRAEIVRTLAHYNDQNAAAYFETCTISDEASPQQISVECEEEEFDPCTPNPPFLSIPDEVHTLKFVQHASHLKLVEHILENLTKEPNPVVGIDAEWSSYVYKPKATILQVAVRGRIFIIDVEAIGNYDMCHFFDCLFAERKLLKIGYRFSEDLIQLRNAVRESKALRNPVNLICIGNLVDTLLRENVRRPDQEPDGFLYLTKAEIDDLREEFAQENNNQLLTYKTVAVEKNGTTFYHRILSHENLSGSNFSSPAGHVTAEAIRGTHFKENGAQNILLSPVKDLSTLCERLLGKKLDKAEQCSVWDRRPLRANQLRYAALDAYCMIMLYDKCVEWAERLDLKLSDLIPKQKPPIVSLPLLFDENNH